jgi:hypothetical protein
VSPATNPPARQATDPRHPKPFASNPSGARGSLVEVMAEFRPLARRSVRAGPLREALDSSTLNLEIDRYPKFQYDPDPAKGLYALKRRAWGGDFVPLVPPNADKLNAEFELLRIFHDSFGSSAAPRKRPPNKLLELLVQAIALNRAIWRDATVAEFSNAADSDTVGEYIRALRRKKREAGPASFHVGWAERGETHYGARLPVGAERWALLVGGLLPHVIQSELVVVDLGACRFQSWAPCTNDAEHGSPCRCRYCMHTVDSSLTSNPDLERRIREDSTIQALAEFSSSAGWGPSGPLASLRQADPGLSAYGIRLVALFGRPQFDASLASYRRWLGLRRSGKKVGRPAAAFDATTAGWIARRRADGVPLTRVYAEYLARPGVAHISWTTFYRRYRGSRAGDSSKPPLSANPN